MKSEGLKSIFPNEKAPVPDPAQYGQAEIQRIIPNDVIREVSSIEAWQLGTATASVALVMFGIYKYGNWKHAKEQRILPILHEP
jgi:hypothetical protein